MSHARILFGGRRPHTLGRATLVALACLNLALMPCALLASSESECPGCPDAERAHHGGGHMQTHAAEGPGDRENACDTAGNDCCGVVAIGKDDRPTQPTKPADSAAPAAAPPPSGLPFIAMLRRDAAPATGPPVPPSSRRLHVHFCIYLI